MYKFSISQNYALRYKNIFYSLILQKIGTRENINILDIGCKDGEDLLNVSKGRNFRLYGLDKNTRKSWFSSGQSKCIFIQGMAEQLPFKDNTTDIIIASEIIEHISEVERFLSEVLRILRQDSYIFITTPPRYTYTTMIGRFVPRRFKKKLRKLVYPTIGEMDGIKQILPDGTIIKEHVYEYIPEELKDMLEKNGFDVESIHQGFLAVPLCPLFDKAPFLLKAWEVLDTLISKLPLSIYIKANFIIVARKPKRY